MHSRIFSSIPGFYPLDTSHTTSPVVITRMSPDIAKCTLEGKINPGGEPLLETNLSLHPTPYMFELLAIVAFPYSSTEQFLIYFIFVTVF